MDWLIKFPHLLQDCTYLTVLRTVYLHHSPLVTDRQTDRHALHANPNAFRNVTNKTTTEQHMQEGMRKTSPYLLSFTLLSFLL